MLGLSLIDSPVGMSGMKQVRYFPAFSETGSKDGLIFEFQPLNALPWIGIFAFGDAEFSAIAQLGNSSRTLVVSQGDGWIVDSTCPNDFEQVHMCAISGLKTFGNKTVLHNYSSMQVFENSNVLWIARDIVDSHLEVMAMEDHHLVCSGRDCGKDVRTLVDLETGTCQQL